MTQGVSGTSASTPSVAGIFALLNDARMSAGKSPLGFLNPFIYKNMDAFNDIKKGKNNGGGLKSILPGFEATTGWDPVTGVGTPNYPKLLAAALATP
jgi:tripeptidyl-peptidase-1